MKKIKLIMVLVFVLIVSSFAYADHPLSENLTSYWSFDVDGRDDWGSNGATFFNGATINTGLAISGGSLQLDGVNDYARVLNSASLNSRELSMSVWVRQADDNAVTNRIIHKQNSYNLITRDPSLNYRSTFWNESGATNSFDTTSGTLTYNSWVHLVVTISYDRIIAYKNGVAISNESNAGGYITTTGIDTLYFGIDEDLTFFMFKGNIDEVYIYSRPITSEEVAILYDGGSAFDFKGEILPHPPTSNGITSPTENQLVELGDNLNISWNAFSDPRDTLITYNVYLNSSVIASNLSSTYYVYDTSVLSVGFYSVFIEGCDNASSCSNSTSVNFEIVNNIPPSVNIILPITNQVIDNDFTIVWSAIDTRESVLNNTIIINDFINETILVTNYASNNYEFTTHLFDNAFYELIIQTCEINSSELYCVNDSVDFFINNPEAPPTLLANFECPTTDNQIKLFGWFIIILICMFVFAIISENTWIGTIAGMGVIWGGMSIWACNSTIGGFIVGFGVLSTWAFGNAKTYKDNN